MNSLILFSILLNLVSGKPMFISNYRSSSNDNSDITEEKCSCTTSNFILNDKPNGTLLCEEVCNNKRITCYSSGEMPYKGVVCNESSIPSEDNNNNNFEVVSIFFGILLVVMVAFILKRISMSGEENKNNNYDRSLNLTTTRRYGNDTHGKNLEESNDNETLPKYTEEDDTLSSPINRDITYCCFSENDSSSLPTYEEAVRNSNIKNNNY